MRGALKFVLVIGWPSGIIPAYAGSTTQSAMATPSCRDHPRVCGEHRDSFSFVYCRLGSSPRMRGAPGGMLVTLGLTGIIPAYAGST